MSSDYQNVQKALTGGADPAMLCTTCPWDRNCITPPEMTAADIEARMQEGAAKDRQLAAEARAAGRDPGVPTGTLLTALMFAGRDLSAYVCPVFSLRLRSSGGRKIADTFKAQMQEWDDQR